MNRLTILITNVILDGRSGTEVLVRNIALELQARGHSPIVYSPSLGEIAAELRRRSVPVVDDLRQVQRPVDVIHAHHLPTALTASAFFPDAPVLFFCHDYLAWHDAPPHLPSILRYVAVDRTLFDRLTIEGGVPLDKAQILLNPVDTARFVPGPPLNDRPKSALAFAKNDAHIDVIKAVCESRGIPVSFIGNAVGVVASRPEDILPQHDLVFASAISAMEAMACGRAVVVCDGRGLAGFCTQARFDDWRELNFGLRTLRQPLTFEAINQEIERYDSREAAAVGDRLRSEGGMQAYADRLEGLYDDAMRARSAAPWSDRALLLSLGAELQDFCAPRDGGAPWLRERQSLLGSIERLSIGVERAPVGELLRFSAAETERFWRPVAGFSPREEWGMWTKAAFASAMMHVEADGDLRVTFRLRPFLPDSATRRLKVEVLGNSMPLAIWDFDSGEESDAVVSVPRALLADDAAFWFSFRISHPRSPKELNLSVDDERPLGIGLISMIIERGVGGAANLPHKGAPFAHKVLGALFHRTGRARGQ